MQKKRVWTKNSFPPFCPCQRQFQLLLYFLVRGMAFGLEMLTRSVMKRMQRGLYHGRHIGFGNKVSEDGGNRTRRTWKPNVHWKRVYSLTLSTWLRLRMSTHAMRCIDRAGGIDEYLLTTSPKKMQSEVGLVWKKRILMAQEGAQKASETEDSSSEKKL
eukprot:TRINITY_DN27248_c0_g1_i1.p1 TRINITY_DN27248_c0_g1~~TRINITY_DN27248_c0_g1_i1.p1  ORF type:complete len:159 (+),score=5.86 TRINITY_DN27248_c0_g1_i1:60-536(+)